MATRFRLPSAGAPDVSPAFQSYTHSGSTRRYLAPGSEDASALSTVAITPDAADHLTAGDAFHAQFVSAPLVAGIAFVTSDTVKYALQGLEANASNDLFIQLWVGVYSEDGGTLRATICGKAADATELATTLTNRTSSHALSANYTTVVGDRLVVEFSVTGTPTAAGGVQGHNASLRWGSNGAGGDLAENDTDTGTTVNPWIEISRTVTFQPPPPGRRMAGALLAAALAVWAPNPVVEHIRQGSGPTSPPSDPPAYSTHKAQHVAARAWWPEAWRAQGPRANAALFAAAPSADNPPGRRADPSRIVDAWQPRATVVHVRAGGGGPDPAADAPAPRQPRVADTVLRAWEAQSWRAQKAAPSAGWNVPVVAPDSPPGRRLDLSSILGAWQDAPITPQRAEQNAAWNVPAVAPDNPPVKGTEVPSGVAAAWLQTWSAQRAAPNAAWNVPVVAADNPPVRRADPSRIVDAWLPRTVVIRLDGGAGGPDVATADNPPPLSRAAFYRILTAHERRLITLEVREAADGVVGADEPPRRLRQPESIAAAWSTSWDAQRARPSAAWNVPIVAADNPPVRGTRVPAGVAATWLQTWSAQRAAPNAAWNLVPDAPSPRDVVDQAAVASSWQQSWGAQRARPNAAWNVVVPDAPPPRKVVDQVAVAKAWQQSWGAQHSQPSAAWNVAVPDAPPPRKVVDQVAVAITWQQSWGAQHSLPNAAWNVEPPPTALYGWGARSKIGGTPARDLSQSIGGTPARDLWKSIGDTTAKAKKGEIGGDE